MSLLDGFDWENQQAQQPGEFSGEPIPNGTYYFTIANAEEKPTRDGTGAYLKLEFECLADEHRGRKVWENFNLKNKNQTAVDIARKQLKAVMDAIGKKPNTISEFVGAVLKLEVVVKPRNDDPGKMTNEVKTYLPSGKAPPAPGIEKEVAAATEEDTPF